MLILQGWSVQGDASGRTLQCTDIPLPGGGGGEEMLVNSMLTHDCNRNNNNSRQFIYRGRLGMCRGDNETGWIMEWV